MMILIGGRSLNLGVFFLINIFNVGTLSLRIMVVWRKVLSFLIGFQALRIKEHIMVGWLLKYANALDENLRLFYLL